MMTSNNKINTKNTMPITEKPKMEIKETNKYFIKVREEERTLIKIKEEKKRLMEIREADNFLMKVREQGGYLIEIREGGYATDPVTCRPPSKLPPSLLGFFENLNFWQPSTTNTTFFCGGTANNTYLPTYLPINSVPKCSVGDGRQYLSTYN